MRGLFAARTRDERPDELFDRIGAFLASHGLSPDPEHYRFAHAVLSDPAGPIARAVNRLTDGGVRLSGHDLEALGGVATAGPAIRHAPPGGEPDDGAAALVAETRARVDGFATMVHAIHDETRDFGEDLERSAAAMSRGGLAGIDEIARLTGSMLARVRDTEARLADATVETDALRAKLAEANDHARRDPLTGLPNRRAFEEAFAALDPARGPYAVAVCDIDRFKRINDDHGHAVGDRVLSVVGRLLADTCDGHLVARYGGEEFTIILAGLDLVAATSYLDEVRAVVAAKRFRNRETDRPLGEVTVSIGVTALHDADTTADALGRADRLLYAAKTDGRDRVCAA